MGPANDPIAALDEHGRFRGVENLHVADASICHPFRGPTSTSPASPSAIAWPTGYETRSKRAPSVPAR
jgi:choline dehydrogenase-like flavoprotein